MSFHLSMLPLPIIRCFVAGLSIILPVVTGQADESEDHARQALQITTDAAKLYQFEIAGKPTRQLVLYPESILRWSNPVVGEVYGNVFVWTHDGRPEVIGSIFQWYSPHTHGSHEFHSLALDRLKATRDGAVVWMATQPGIVWHSLANQPAVADSRASRLRQARAISRGFKIKKTDREQVSRDLRLLAQPIYRYGSDKSDVRDGSLFVFVEGTDPEVFLLIEARDVGKGLQWQYALARMNSVNFVATYQGQEVWRTEIWPWSKIKNGQETYTSMGPFPREEAKR